MKASLLTLMILCNGFLKAQYPFEKYPPMRYFKKYHWTFYDRQEKENKMHWTMSFPHFFNHRDSLTVQLTSFGDKDTSLIRIFKNKTQIQLLKEPFAIGRNFGMLIDTAFYGDINGDSLLDLKIVCWYGGCGTASLNERVIYLFQKPNEKFTKISYLDKSPSERLERDFDGDGNYEIITMTLTSYENHSYWLYNLYNHNSDGLINVNPKHDYPIMIQFLHRDNYQITNKISKQKMKNFGLPLPEEYDKK